MRHIRNFHRLANRSISSPDQWFQLIKTSSACLHLVASETSNLVHGSSIQSCGRSYSASSNTLEAKKPQRRVSVDERKSMVENYVNRYREMNAGKFPSASDVMRNVGGGYYTIRKVLQEMIYYSNIPLTETKDSVPLERSSVKKDEVCTDAKKAFQRKKLVDHISPISKVDVRDGSFKSFESKKGLLSPILKQSDVSEVDGSQSHRLVNEPKSSQKSHPENSVKHETVHEDKLNLDRLQPRTELQQSTESDVSRRVSPKEPTEEAETPRKSSVWQNLRSFANEILGIWKRS